jgi:SAM-dependent methyltransferase
VAAAKNSPTKLPPLALLREERDLIVQRASLTLGGPDEPPFGMDHLKWYLDLSMDWGVVTLTELFKQKPGALLDIGAYYGLVAGCAFRAGWQISAVDVTPIPSFSSLAIDSRHVQLGVCNVCLDPLPFPDASFDALLFNEVLEHLLYAPMLLFREFRRVLVPGGRLYLTTPNPAAISKLIRLARGGNNEPFLRTFFVEDDAYEYKGTTFFKSQRESRLWTVGELTEVLPGFGLKVVGHYYYGNTVTDGSYVTASQRVRFKLNRMLRPLVRRNRLLGGGTFVIAKAV